MSIRRGSRPPTEEQKKILRASTRASGVSEYRKANIQGEIDSGIVVEAGSYEGSKLRSKGDQKSTYNGPKLSRGAWTVPEGNSVTMGPRRGITVVNGGTKSAIGAVAHSESFYKQQASEIIKEATISAVGGTSSTSAGASVERLAPEVYSPLFTMANLNLPRDRITVNAWVRNFFLLHPIVRNAITLHATYPISKLNLKCSDRKVLQFFEDMIEEMNLMESLGEVSLEFWKLGECVRAGNYLRTSNGIKRMDSIKIGDEVLTHTGSYKKVKEKLMNWDHKKYLSILVRGSFEPLEVSPNHPFYIIKQSGKRIFSNKNNYVWEKAENLKINDICVIPINRTIKDKNITKEMCRIIGLYLSEGCLSYNRKYNKTNEPKGIIISNTDENLWLYYKNTFAQCDFRLALNRNNGYLRSLNAGRQSTPKTAKMMKEYAGEYSKSKELSQEIMFLPPEKQLEIINGFIDGDGWIHRGRICMATISKVLAYQIREILARNYITCSINVHSKNRKNEIYFIEVPLFYADKFSLYTTKQVKLNEERKKRLLKANNKPRIKFSPEGHLLTPIKKIEEYDLPEGEPLFNLEVEDDNSYCVNGIAVHNCFPYAEFDENHGKWSRIVVQNPDYIHVKKTVLSGEPIISLKPDAVLKRLVYSNNPADVQLRKQIPEKILYYVRQGLDIPLDNFNVSHLKMLSSPYDIRGTSIVVSAFKDLMLYDKLRECYSEDTEYLTENGFKKYDNVLPDEKLATLNSENGKLEYQNYTNRTQYHYEGDMYHFYGKKIDVLVTPNHRMWLSKYNCRKGFGDYNFIKAEDVVTGCKYRSQSVVKWEGKSVESVKVLDNEIPIKDYLEFLGYIISDGSVRYCEKKGSYCVALSQLDKSPEFEKMKKCFYKVGSLLSNHVSIGSTKSKNGSVISLRLYGKSISKFFYDEIGSGAHNKRIPSWIKELNSDLLKIILRSLVDGDGRILTGDLRGETEAYSYSTVSEQLANDVQEMALKCGYAPRLDIKYNGRGTKFYSITWSLSSKFGKHPYIYSRGRDIGSRGAGINKKFYSGNVSCFTVPNSLLVVRRNGLITIQGNSKFAQADGLINPLTIIKVGGNTDGEYRATQEDIEFFRQILEEAQYDKDFKLVTHAGVSVERVGAAGQVLEIAGDMELIIKNIYTGLMVPPAVIDTESAVYASASIGLEVLRQRYFNFRNTLASWLVEKVFAPISEVQKFYELKDGVKRLIVPEVEWNQMNLYDLQDYISNITGLVGSKQVSLQTLYRSLGLNFEDERIKMRQEMIYDAIKLKEEEALRTMTLTELRSLDPEKEILEPVDEMKREPGAEGAVPGGMPGGGGEMGLPGGLPELAPPPGGELGVPGAGAPEGGGITPGLGPGTPGAAPTPGGIGGGI